MPISNAWERLKRGGTSCYKKRSGKKKKKSGVALTQLSLTFITVEEYFIIGTTFIFNLYFLYFVADELSTSIIIFYNF